MKVLLIAPKSESRRATHYRTYLALQTEYLDVTWCSGSFLDIYRWLDKGKIILERVNVGDYEKRDPQEYAPDHFDIAVIDQSVTWEYEHNTLDFEGGDRPSDIVYALTKHGTVCIGTSREGKCLPELQESGAVFTCKLEDVPYKLDGLLREAERIVEDNSAAEDSALKGLTLRQPWANAVFQFGKDVENRNWPARVRGTIAIHVAEEQPPGTFYNGSKFIRQVLLAQGKKRVRMPKYEELPRGVIIGVVDLVDVTTEATSPWFEGPLGFRLANPRLLAPPIPCSGQRRFFRLPADVEVEVRQQLASQEAGPDSGIVKRADGCLRRRKK